MGRHMNSTVEVGSAAPLEFLARALDPDEFHFYGRGLTLAGLAPIVGGELAAAEALVLRMPRRSSIRTTGNRTAGRPRARCATA